MQFEYCTHKTILINVQKKCTTIIRVTGSIFIQTRAVLIIYLYFSSENQLIIVVLPVAVLDCEPKSLLA